MYSRAFKAKEEVADRRKGWRRGRTERIAAFFRELRHAHGHQIYPPYPNGPFGTEYKRYFGLRRQWASLAFGLCGMYRWGVAGPRGGGRHPHLDLHTRFAPHGKAIPQKSES